MIADILVINIEERFLLYEGRAIATKIIKILKNIITYYFFLLNLIILYYIYINYNKYKYKDINIKKCFYCSFFF